jgi:hypothetical protein
MQIQNPIFGDVVVAVASGYTCNDAKRTFPGLYLYTNIYSYLYVGKKQ